MCEGLPRAAGPRPSDDPRHETGWRSGRRGSPPAGPHPASAQPDRDAGAVRAGRRRYAIAWSDLVLIPTKTSGMDLQELYRTYAVVQRTEKALRRRIEARAVFSQIPALKNRISNHARSLVTGKGIPVLTTEILHRPSAY